MTEPAGKPIRSPSYPSMPLREAIAAIQKIEAKYRSSAVDREAAVKLLGYSGLSGPANKVLAALASYGLLERAGKGEARVTARARAILHAHSEGERTENLLAAASEPELFKEIRERFSDIPVPPEDGVITYLNRQGFNPNAVRPAAKAFLQTMEYIEELRETESHGNDKSAGANYSNASGEKSIAFGGAKLGDLIQWESQGSLQFPQPLRVRLISDDGQWVAVEGSNTGIPMNEVIVETPAPQRTTAPPFFPVEEKHDAQSADAKEWFRARVGPGKQVIILYEGEEEIDAREIGKLIKVLEAQKLALEDE